MSVGVWVGMVIAQVFGSFFRISSHTIITFDSEPKGNHYLYP